MPNDWNIEELTTAAERGDTGVVALAVLEVAKAVHRVADVLEPKPQCASVQDDTTGRNPPIRCELDDGHRGPHRFGHMQWVVGKGEGL